MKFIDLLAGSLSLLLVPLHAGPSSHLEVLESLSFVPVGWVQSKAPSPSELLKFRLAIRQARAAEVERHLIDVSTPDHGSYGNFLSREKLKNVLRPDPKISNAILDWLKSSNISSHNVEDDSDWINFVASVDQAENLMKTKFYYYNHRVHGSIIRTLHYSIPSSLHGDVQMIQPTIRFGGIRPYMSSVRGGKVVDDVSHPTGYDTSFCNQTITPDCLRGLYGLENSTADPLLGNKLGLSGFLEEYAQYADLQSFYNMFTNYSNADNFSVVSINGGFNTQEPNSSLDSGEANLDVQYGLSLSRGTPASFYTTGGLGPLVPDLDQPGQPGSNEPYLDQLHYLLQLPDDGLPTVLTTSYGEEEQSIPESYTNATCALFVQLGLRGVSVIFSSGDSGVSSTCQTNDGSNTTRFSAQFPASCPFVTSVGGTYGVEPERAAPFSSGGFSDRFPRPSYQEDAVRNYLETIGDQWEGLYNPEGRAFPDVSAQSIDFLVVDKGQTKAYQGTSCAAPVFAAIIANLNNIRMGAGFGPLGFLNPWLYSHGYEGLTDIVDGGSTGCTGIDPFSGLTTPHVPYASWNATQGWDPVTGLGTPNFQKMVETMFLFDRPGRNETVMSTKISPVGRPKFLGVP